MQNKTKQQQKNSLEVSNFWNQLCGKFVPCVWNLCIRQKIALFFLYSGKSYMKCLIQTYRWAVVFVQHIFLSFLCCGLGLGLGLFESKYNDVAESGLSASQHSIKRMRSSFSAQSFSFCISPHLSRNLSSLLCKTC